MPYNLDPSSLYRCSFDGRGRSNGAHKLDTMTGRKRVGSKVGPPGGSHYHVQRKREEPKAKPKARENKRARVYA